MDENPYKSPAAPPEQTRRTAGLWRMVSLAWRIAAGLVFGALVVVMIAGVLILLFLVI